ncbi:MAG: hypothetical protein AVDCRST_MAG69-856 [uncultured Solirubrobacteraceae bacterium]|uniref:ABC-type glycine betaine transport system substrate-binding domain-containing protein n=1 Tax=uncultured Solirubrobacteraceae bacterium TaxID=1162706 RepID=A0A6J4RV09_9ACTN|nr:MAG: hypothetical protein AVDCRST_MAG69-856 [uncultured Solirubrobacteraceae bacterium]
MIRRTLAVLVAALLAVGCGGSDDTVSARSESVAAGTTPIRIGTKNFTEQYILGELYRQALEAKDFRVELKRDIGSSEIIHRALTGGALDMYPEYIGVLLSEVAGDHQRPRDARAAYEQAKAYEESDGFTLLEMTPFSDSNALAVTSAYARRRGVTRIPDLESAAGDRIRIGAPPEFRSRFEGLIGLRQVYGLRDLELEPLRIGDQYGALDRGAVDAAAVFTTDGQLAARRYVRLEDPEGLFAAQHVAPVIDRDTLEAHGPELPAAIDAVSRRLTTRAMREMNAAVDLDGQDPAAVAERFLAAEGLL